MMTILVAGQDFSCMAKKLQDGSNSSRSELKVASTVSVSPKLACKLREPAKQGMLKVLSFVPRPQVAVAAVSVETCSVVRTQALQATPLASVRAQRPSQAKSELRI